MKLIAYLNFNGQCEEALNFYKSCFRGTVLQFSRMGEGPMPVPESHKNKIMHARLKFGDNIIYMSDVLAGNEISVGNNIKLSLEINQASKMNDLFARLSDGGKIIMPLQDTFWHARFGQFIDRFGIQWLLNCELKK